MNNTLDTLYKLAAGPQSLQPALVQTNATVPAGKGNPPQVTQLSVYDKNVPTLTTVLDMNTNFNQAMAALDNMRKVTGVGSQTKMASWLQARELMTKEALTWLGTWNAIKHPVDTFNRKVDEWADDRRNHLLLGLMKDLKDPNSDASKIVRLAGYLIGGSAVDGAADNVTGKIKDGVQTLKNGVGLAADAIAPGGRLMLRNAWNTASNFFNGQTGGVANWKWGLGAGAGLLGAYGAYRALSPNEEQKRRQAEEARQRVMEQMMMQMMLMKHASALTKSASVYQMVSNSNSPLIEYLAYKSYK